MHSRTFLIASVIFGLTGVMLGAFGAHGLQKLTDDEQVIKGFQTAVFYQMIHAIILMITGMLSEQFPGNWFKRAGAVFIAGVVLFSGSLYLITFSKIQQAGGLKFLGPLTPAGGLFLITGWLFLLFGLLHRKSGDGKA